MRKIISIGLVVTLALTAVLSVQGNGIVTSQLADEGLACLQGGRDCEWEAILIDVACYLFTGWDVGCAVLAAGYYILCVFGIV